MTPVMHEIYMENPCAIVGFVTKGLTLYQGIANNVWVGTLASNFSGPMQRYCRHCIGVMLTSRHIAGTAPRLGAMKYM